MIKRRGVTLTELVIGLCSASLLAAMLLPTLQARRHAASEAMSMVNLHTLNLAQALYAGDWDDRQVQYLADDISVYGNNAISAMLAFNAANGVHPPMTLGWGENVAGFVVLYAYYLQQSGNVIVHEPIRFEPANELHRFVAFRSANARPLHNYLGGKFYDPVYYAPDDTLLIDRVEPLFDEPWEFVDTPSLPNLGAIPVWSSYCWSPAAMFHPGVMASARNGGWRNPWLFNPAFAAPRVSQARYASLKTRMMEHNWLRPAPPRPANPGGQGPSPIGLSDPWQFNHAINARPLALMFDGSVGALWNTDVQAADQALLAKTGEGLWHRGTPFGAAGYRGAIAFDDEVDLSHHILTVDGILGRDILAGGWE